MRLARSWAPHGPGLHAGAAQWNLTAPKCRVFAYSVPGAREPSWESRVATACARDAVSIFTTGSHQRPWEAPVLTRCDAASFRRSISLQYRNSLGFRKEAVAHEFFLAQRNASLPFTLRGRRRPPLPCHPPDHRLRLLCFGAQRGALRQPAALLAPWMPTLRRAMLARRSRAINTRRVDR